jgi:acyl carrier protein
MNARPTPGSVVAAALARVAPDVDPGDLDADLHDDLGLDSMDLLNIAAAISAGAGVEIPERDLAGLRTLRRLEAYVGRQLDHTTEVAR